MKKILLVFFLITSVNLFSKIIDNMALGISYDNLSLSLSKNGALDLEFGLALGVHISDDYLFNDPQVDCFLEYKPFDFKYFKPEVGLGIGYIYLNEPTFHNNLVSLALYTGGDFRISKKFDIGLNLGYKIGESTYLQEKSNDYFLVKNKGSYELFPFYIKIQFNYYL